MCLTSVTGSVNHSFSVSRASGSAGVEWPPPASWQPNWLCNVAFLERVYNTYRSMTPSTRRNVWNTALLIGWDEPGGTYDPVPPGPVPPPDKTAPPGELGFKFDRSGYRVPAIMVSPWVESGSVYNDEYRHTSLIATLRKVWGLGEPLTDREASARTFDQVFAFDNPRGPEKWVDVVSQPVPQWVHTKPSPRETYPRCWG